MKEILEKLERNIDAIPGKFLAMDGPSLNLRPGPDKWNKKEILGHLVDSALINIQRIIRVQYEPGVKIVYDQNRWVRIQDYQNLDTESLVMLWRALNQQFVRVIRNFPAGKLQEQIDTGKSTVEMHTAEFLISDYLTHMEHHLRQIFGSGS